MQKIVRSQLLLLAILVVTSSLSFSQDKYGGLTLYTLRNEMGKDSAETLKAVADAGYKYIEAADYRDGKFYNMSPEELKKSR
jgi:hypothetical protein